MEIQKPSVFVPEANRASSAEGQKAQLKHACQQFESLFLLQLWRAMQKTVPRSTQTLNYARCSTSPLPNISRHGGLWG